MDWEAVLRHRLADPVNQVPYVVAVGMEGHPLPWDRRICALADVLAVKPADLIADLRDRSDQDNAQDERFIDNLALIADEVCGFAPAQLDGVRSGGTRRRSPQPIPFRRATAQGKDNAAAAYDHAVRLLGEDKQFMRESGVILLRRAAELSPDPTTLRMIRSYAASYIRLKTGSDDLAHDGDSVLNSIRGLIQDIAATEHRDASSAQRPATPVSPHRAGLPAWRSILSRGRGRGD